MNLLTSTFTQLIGSLVGSNKSGRPRFLRQEKKKITRVLARFMKDYKNMRRRGDTASRADMLLIEIRGFLDDSAKTAMAIDKGYPLKKIAKCAKKEKYNDLARVLCLAA